ncbi:MAG: patatin-like phospholipase family protein [bacterium]|nr:patatin-like phospholipase family protein [bacterium]
MKKVGIALGGGGAKGVTHIAFLEALDEMGYKPSVISGTSIGAIIGAFYAAGMSPFEMKLLLKKINFQDIRKMMDFSLIRSKGMVKGKGVENFISKYLPVAAFEELKIPLKVVATDFWNRNEVILESGNLVTALRASMSMPMVFKPVQWGDQVLIDGGVINPLPYDIIRKDCDVCIAIDVSGEKTPKKHKIFPGMIESVLSTLQIMQASIVNTKKENFPPDIYIKPELTNIRILEFFKHEEILKGVQGDVDIFKEELTKRMKRFAFFSKREPGKKLDFTKNR